MKKQWNWPSALIGLAAGVVLVGATWGISAAVQANGQAETERIQACDQYSPSSTDYWMCVEQ